MKLRIQSHRFVGSAVMAAALCTSVSTVALAADNATQSNASVSCESLAALSLPGAKVTEAQTITDGTFKAPEAKEPLKGLPPFCRVHVVVSPAINIEIWMPLKGWNGKLMGLTAGGVLG